MPRIGPHKAEHISRSRQVLRTIFLERLEKGRLDAQHLTDIVDIEPQFLPLLAQELANRAWLRRRCRRLVNGAPGGSVADQAHLMVLDPAEPGTAQSLALLGVTAVAIHPGATADVPVSPREPTRAAGYRLVGRFPDKSSVWDVVAPPAPAFVTFAGGFGLPRRLGDGAIGYPLVASGGVALVELRAKVAGIIRLVFDATAPSGNHQLRVQDAQGEHPLVVNGHTHVDLSVEVPRGVSQLLVKVDPAPTSESDAVVLSQPRAEPASGAATLHAIPSSADPGF